MTERLRNDSPASIPTGMVAEVEPVRKNIRVKAGVEKAYRVFT